MCGRTACTRSSGEIADACTFYGKNKQSQKPQWKHSSEKMYNSSYNKGPKSLSPILLSNRMFGENKNISERALLTMQWGMVPSWHKGNPKSFSFNMINCRADTLAEKKSFSNALQKGQRCVVLADGFYEWHVSGKEKQPYYIHLKEFVKPHDADNTDQKQLLTMAGLFDVHQSEEGELYSYTIITVDASSSMKWLHQRMPAILETPEKVEKWLNTDQVSSDDALDLLVPTNCVEWYPVSSVVNNVRNDVSDCIKKIDLQKEMAKKNRSSKMMASWLQKGSKRKSEENNANSEDEKKKKT